MKKLFKITTFYVINIAVVLCFGTGLFAAFNAPKKQEPTLQEKPIFRGRSRTPLLPAPTRSTPLLPWPGDELLMDNHQARERNQKPRTRSRSQRPRSSHGPRSSRGPRRKKQTQSLRAVWRKKEKVQFFSWAPSTRSKTPTVLSRSQTPRGPKRSVTPNLQRSGLERRDRSMTVFPSIVRDISGAQKEVLVATTELSNDLVIGALVAAKARGVNVIVVCDEKFYREKVAKKESLAQKLEPLGKVLNVPNEEAAFIFRQGFLMHHAFVCVDRKIVYTGSANFTENASYCWESCIRIESSKIAQVYLAHFNLFLLRKKSTSVPSNYSDNDIEVFFRRGGSSYFSQWLIGKITSEFPQAGPVTGLIRIAVYRFTNLNVLKCLCALAQRGVNVEIIIDAEYTNDFLKKWNCQEHEWLLLLQKFQNPKNNFRGSFKIFAFDARDFTGIRDLLWSHMHHKFIVVKNGSPNGPGTFIFGSSNITDLPAGTGLFSKYYSDLNQTVPIDYRYTGEYDDMVCITDGAFVTKGLGVFDSLKKDVQRISCIDQCVLDSNRGVHLFGPSSCPSSGSSSSSSSVTKPIPLKGQFGLDESQWPALSSHSSSSSSSLSSLFSSSRSSSVSSLSSSSSSSSVSSSTSLPSPVFCDKPRSLIDQTSFLSPIPESPVLRGKRKSPQRPYVSRKAYKQKGMGSPGQKSSDSDHRMRREVSVGATPLSKLSLAGMGRSSGAQSLRSDKVSSSSSLLSSSVSRRLVFSDGPTEKQDGPFSPPSVMSMSSGPQSSGSMLSTPVVRPRLLCPGPLMVPGPQNVHRLPFSLPGSGFCTQPLRFYPQQQQSFVHSFPMSRPMFMPRPRPMPRHVPQPYGYFPQRQVPQSALQQPGGYMGHQMQFLHPGMQPGFSPNYPGPGMGFSGQRRR